MDGYKTLKAGQPVIFEIIQGPKGLHAVNISAPPRTASAVPALISGQQHEHSKDHA
jgi:CspA family cold shock protein